MAEESNLFVKKLEGNQYFLSLDNDFEEKKIICGEGVKVFNSGLEPVKEITSKKENFMFCFNWVKACDKYIEIVKNNKSKTYKLVVIR